jgi:hypothetical protein
MRAAEDSIKDLATVFDATPMNDRKIELYLDALSDIPDDQLSGVVDVLIETRTSGFLPTPGEIKAAWVETLLGPPMPDESFGWCQAELARQKDDAKRMYFMLDVENRGRFVFTPIIPETFPDPVTMETIRMIGWEDLATMDREQAKGLWVKRYAEARTTVAHRIASGRSALAGVQGGKYSPLFKLLK